MTMYRRIRLGKGGAQRAECIEQGYVGLNYGLHEDLTGKFPPRWRDFNAVFVPYLVENDPSPPKLCQKLCQNRWRRGIWTDFGQKLRKKKGNPRQGLAAKNSSKPFLFLRLGGEGKTDWRRSEARVFVLKTGAQRNSLTATLRRGLTPICLFSQV